MITVQGYNNVHYNDFQQALYKAWESTGKRQRDMSKELHMSYTNFCNTLTRPSQVASDKVITEILNAVGLEGCVVWVLGERYYYLKQNN